jgi:ZIP family zinc transporter
VLFGYVAGMMIYISLRELLPTALRYDPADACVTAAAFWGMAVMAASLLLFKANEH